MSFVFEVTPTPTPLPIDINWPDELKNINKEDTQNNA